MNFNFVFKFSELLTVNVVDIDDTPPTFVNLPNLIEIIEFDDSRTSEFESYNLSQKIFVDDMDEISLDFQFELIPTEGTPTDLITIYKTGNKEAVLNVKNKVNYKVAFSSNIFSDQTRHLTKGMYEQSMLPHQI